MQALLYFAEHLLSRYSSDPFAAYLLQNRVIYLVPVVNPDGYEVNQDIYFGSGGTSFGYWRKNIRDNNSNSVFDDFIDGVDINRNFSFRWGKNNVGSSPAMEDGTYREPSAFSEPESQAQRDLVISRTPKTGISFHTYGDLMLHSWGHTDSPPPHIDAFREWDDELTRDNAYQSGPSPQRALQREWRVQRLVLWRYDFEAPRVHLDTRNRERCRLLLAGALAHPPARRGESTRVLRGVRDRGTVRSGRRRHHPRRRLERELWGAALGAREESRNRRVRIRSFGHATALDPGVQVLVGTVGYPVLSSRQSAEPIAGQTFHLAVDDTVTPGRVVRFKIAFTDAGGFFSCDTLSLPLGTPTIIATDFASSGLGQWSPGSVGDRSERPIASEPLLRR